MPAPRGGRKPGDGGPGRSARKGAGRPRAQRAPRSPRPPRDARALPVVSDAGFALDTPRPFRPAPEYRVESTAGLRREVIELRAEVHRLAAEIDKLWARERGRSATPGRTARSIAGKPVRTGTRVGPKRGGSAGPKSRGPGGPKRSTGAKRSSGWAKPKTRSRRSGTTPRRQGR